MASKAKKPFDLLIAHYTAIAKGGDPLQAHYAMGVLDVLRPLAAVREEWEAEMKRLWETRIGTGGEKGGHMTIHRIMKHLARDLDSLKVGEGCGV